VAIDAAGNLYIADGANNRVREVNAGTGIITTLAGNGTQGYNGDNKPANTAEANDPFYVAVDAAGNVYITDSENSRIREVGAVSGLIATIAGTSSPGSTGDGGLATSAGLYYPAGITLDAVGNIYFVDGGPFNANNGQLIRKIAAATGIIGTVAGGGTSPSTCSGSVDLLGDGCVATDAVLGGNNQLNLYGVAVDPAGDIYISGGYQIRKVTAATSIITSLAGNGTQGYSGDGGPSTAALLGGAVGVSLDAVGNIYLPDHNDGVLRKIAAAAPALSFASTKVGSDSKDGPKSVSLNNIGNQALTLPAPTSGNNPSVASGFLLDTASTTCPNLNSGSKDGPLASGANCVYAFDFKPVSSGKDDGSAVITDDALNAAPGTQTIPLSGTGLAVIADMGMTGLPDSETAGIQETVVLTAYSSPSVVATDYTGTVHFTSSDSQAILPADYTYTTADAGVHNFNVTLETLGSQSVTAADTVSTSISASENTTVNASVPIHLDLISGSGQSASVGTAYPTDLSARVTDLYGNVIGGHTVVFTEPASGASGLFGSQTSAAIPTDSNGLATTPITANAAAGNFSVVADGKFGQTVPFSLTNNKAATTTSLGVSPVTSPVYGQPVSLSSKVGTNVANTIALLAPTGILAITDNSSPLFSGPLTGQAVGGAGAASSASYANSAATLAVGPHSFAANYPGDSDNNTSSSITVSYTVNKVTPVLAGPATQPVQLGVGQSGSIPISVSGPYTGVGILPPSGSIAYNFGPGASHTAPIASGVATIPISSTLPSGNFTVTVSYAGDTNYSAARNIGIQLDVALLTQTITFPAPPSSVVLGVGPITLAATASSGLPVSYSVMGPATLSGSVLTVTGTGAIGVTATQAGNNTYDAATPVTRTIVVQKVPLIQWPQPSDLAYGVLLGPGVLDATAVDPQTKNKVPGTYVYTPAEGTKLPAGQHPLSVQFTPTDTTTYASASGQATIAIDKGPTYISYTLSPTQNFGPTSLLNVDTPIYMIFNFQHVGPTPPSGFIQITDTLGALKAQVAASTPGLVFTIDAIGNDGLNVTYLGDSNYYPSSAIPNGVTIGVPTMTYTQAYSGNPYQTNGETVTYTGTPAFGYTGTINVANACRTTTPLPEGIACTYTPNTVFVDGTDTPVTFSSNFNVTTIILGTLFWPFPLGLLAFGLRRSRKYFMLVVILASSMLLATTSCGCPPTIQSVLGPGTYTVNIQTTAQPKTASKDLSTRITFTLQGPAQ